MQDTPTYTVPSGSRLRRLGAAAVQAGVAIAILAAAVIGADRLVATRPAPPERAASEPRYAAETVRAEVGERTPLIEAFGEVRARNVVELRALVSGTVVDVAPELVAGGRIEAGATLVTIDRFSFEGAVVGAEASLLESRARLDEVQAQLRSEQASLVRMSEQLDIAERELTRQTDLRRRRIVAEAAVDSARRTLSQARQARDAQASAVTVTQSRIAQSRAAITRLEWELRQARRDLDDTVLRAPFDAVVREESVEPGRRLGSNDIVATLYEAGALDLRLTLSDGQYGRAIAGNRTLIGRPVRVTWPVGAEPVRALARIERVAADVASRTGGVELFARIDTVGAAATLKPGAFVTAQLEDRTFSGAARLPEAALYASPLGRHVFVVDEADRLERRSVDVLAYEGADVIVRGDLHGRDVLATRLAEAGDGVLVRRVAPAAGAEEIAGTGTVPAPVQGARSAQ